MELEIILLGVNILLGMVLGMVGYIVKKMDGEIAMLQKKVDGVIKELPENYTLKVDLKYMIDMLGERFDRWEDRIERLLDKMENKSNQK